MSADWASSRLIRKVKLPSRWGYVDDDGAKGLERQLSIELVEGHVLFGFELEAIARSHENDDVVFAEQSHGDRPVQKYWLVHLTWGSSRDPRWPDSREIAFPDDLWDEWEGT